MKAILEFRSQELPVTIDYIKTYFAIDESDEHITNLLQVAIEYVELQNGVSLGKKIWKMIHDNNYICLNFPPIIKLLSVTDAQENEIKPISVKRCNDSLIVQVESINKMVHVRYEAGYDQATLPDCLKDTICEKFWELYIENSNSSNKYNYNYDCAIKTQRDGVYGKYAIKF